MNNLFEYFRNTFILLPLCLISQYWFCKTYKKVRDKVEEESLNNIICVSIIYGTLSGALISFLLFYKIYE